MRTYRRQRKQLVFAGSLGVIGIINLLFFFILYQPIRSEYVRLRESIDRTQGEVQSRRQKIDQLERLNAQLETSAQDKQRLFNDHFIPRSTGWSETLPELEAMVQHAGVKNTRQDYSIDPAPQYGLYSVKIKLPVTGMYPNVVNFIKDLENANTFFIIDEIGVHGNSQPGSQEVTMTLGFETFFYQ
jgi:hypothetical protein